MHSNNFSRTSKFIIIIAPTFFPWSGLHLFLEGQLLKSMFSAELQGLKQNCYRLQCYHPCSSIVSLSQLTFFIAEAEGRDNP